MSTSTFVDTSAHTVTYVTDKLLLSLKEIVRGSGLNPGKMASQWEALELGIWTWLNSKHLKQVHLEIFNPITQKLVCRWDLDIMYGYGGDGGFWVDTDAIRYNISKAGLIPSSCDYRITVDNLPGAATVLGWGDCTLYSTEGLSRYSVGTTIGGNGIGAGVAYWRV
jgi:hypothetical protein